MPNYNDKDGDFLSFYFKEIFIRHAKILLIRTDLLIKYTCKIC